MGDTPLRLELTPAAHGDLSDIWDYTVGRWSAVQAERYLYGLQAAMALLCAAPFVARERAEFAPPVRIHPHKSHLIVYIVEGACLKVVRILHARQNWRAYLAAGE